MSPLFQSKGSCSVLWKIGDGFSYFTDFVITIQSRQMLGTICVHTTCIYSVIWFKIIHDFLCASIHKSNEMRCHNGVFPRYISFLHVLITAVSLFSSQYHCTSMETVIFLTGSIRSVAFFAMYNQLYKVRLPTECVPWRVSFSIMSCFPSYSMHDVSPWCTQTERRYAATISRNM